MTVKRIGTYELIERLASAKSTYRARHVGTGAHVVLKTFTGEFRPNEWNVISRTLSSAPPQGDGICRVVEIGVDGNGVYCVAPFVHGRNVAQVLRALSQHRDVLLDQDHAWVVLRIFAAFARAVHERRPAGPGKALLRNQGITPSELFVTFEGTTQVLDPRWSRLRALTTGERASEIERALAYTIPSELHPPGQPDADDVWAIAVMMWELLCGYRLFRRSSLMQTLRAVARRQVPILRDINPAIPEPLERFLADLIANPGLMSLFTLSERLCSASKVSEEKAPKRVRDWMLRLFPEDAPPGSRRSERPSTRALDSLLATAPLDPEGPREDSTTYTSVAPGVDDKQVVRLSWIGADTAPTAHTIAPTSPPQRRKQRRLSRSLVAGGTAGVLAATAWLTAPPSFDDSVLGARVRTGVPALEIPNEATVDEAAGGVENAYDPFGLEQDPDVVTMLDLPEAPPTEVPAIEVPAIEVPAIEVAPNEATPPSRARAPLTSELQPTTGEVLILAPAGVEIRQAGKLLGVGRFRGKLPVGETTFAARVPEGEDVTTRAHVSPAAMTVVSFE